MDNAPEFRSSYITDWASDRGIELQYTTIYTPEQNGMAERGMQTIANAVRMQPSRLSITS